MPRRPRSSSGVPNVSSMARTRSLAEANAIPARAVGDAACLYDVYKQPQVSQIKAYCHGSTSLGFDAARSSLAPSGELMRVRDFMLFCKWVRWCSIPGGWLTAYEIARP